MEKTWKGKELTDTITLLLAGALFLSPFVLGYLPNVAATWNACISGVVILGLATAAKEWQSDWPEWMIAAMGIWMALSPWVIGFSDRADAMITHIVTGIGTAVIAGVGLWTMHHRSPPKLAS